MKSGRRFGRGQRIPDDCDPFPHDPSLDTAGNGIIQSDEDGDGWANMVDNCPLVANGLDQAGGPGVGNQTDMTSMSVTPAITTRQRLVLGRRRSALVSMLTHRHRRSPAVADPQNTEPCTKTSASTCDPPAISSTSPTPTPSLGPRLLLLACRMRAAAPSDGPWPRQAQGIIESSRLAVRSWGSLRGKTPTFTNRLNSVARGPDEAALTVDDLHIAHAGGRLAQRGPRPSWPAVLIRWQSGRASSPDPNARHLEGLPWRARWRRRARPSLNKHVELDRQCGTTRWCVASEGVKSTRHAPRRDAGERRQRHGRAATSPSGLRMAAAFNGGGPEFPPLGIGPGAAAVCDSRRGD